MASPELRKAADRVDNAYQCFASDNGDGLDCPDWQGAFDYRDDGYEIAEKAFRLPKSAREAFVENAVEEHPESARYLVSVSAAYRLLELSARPVPAHRVAA